MSCNFENICGDDAKFSDLSSAEGWNPKYFRHALSFKDHMTGFLNLGNYTVINGIVLLNNTVCARHPILFISILLTAINCTYCFPCNK